MCSMCTCSCTYGASSLELGERYASCDIGLSLLLKLWLSDATAGAAAAAESASTYCRCCFCCSLLSLIFESRSTGGGK